MSEEQTSRADNLAIITSMPLLEARSRALDFCTSSISVTSRVRARCSSYRDGEENIEEKSTEDSYILIALLSLLGRGDFRLRNNKKKRHEVLKRNGEPRE